MTKRLVLAAVLTALICASAAAGVHFLPDATRDQVVMNRASRALLTWELPEGVLVVDRRGLDEPGLSGRELAPRFADGQWYLVDRGRAAASVDPATFGHVHLTGATTWVVEVPPTRLEAFLGAALSIQYLERATMAPADHAAKSEIAVPIVDPEQKAAYVDALDQDSFDQLLREITGDVAFWHDGGPHMVSTRYYNTAGNDEVTEYLADKLAGYGYTVELDAFTASGHPCRNVVATLVGSETPDEIVVVGGHFDSTSESAGSLAPGAEDNGSGTSLVMELARVSVGQQFERTVQFVLFDAEEIGLRGSQHFVDEAVTEGRTIVAAITADMVAYYDNNYGVIIEGQTEWEWLMTAMADNVNSLTDISYEKTYHSWGSDHVPFQQAGIAAFLAIDQDWSDYPYYHRTTDTFANIAATTPLGLQIGRAAAGTLADVAGLMSTTTGAPSPAVPLVRLAAYPNPFNPVTTLSFSLDVPASGELAVYDVSGRRITTVASGDFLAGEHVVNWTGVDEAGQAVPSGTYVARLRTSEGVVSQKLMLVQ